MRRFAGGIVAFVSLGVLLGGCGTFSGILHVDQRDSAPTVAVETPQPAPDAIPPSPAETVPAVSATSSPSDDVSLSDEVTVVATVDGASAAPQILAQATEAPPIQPPPEEISDQYDPWESFNEKMFNFNYKLDRYVLKPVANVYRKVMPEPLQLGIRNGFDNIGWVPRFVSSMLQGKFGGAGREVARFLINSTAGVGGLFDPAKNDWGIRPSKEDFGQTLGVWGNGPGPYLVLPLLGPMTVRDGIGRGVDTFMNPLGYFIPFLASFGMNVGDTVNDRALNYELFQGVEETTLDLYSSVRHFYLKRREQQIKE